MKSNILKSKFILLSAFICVLFITSCKKDASFIDNSPIKNEILQKVTKYIDSASLSSLSLSLSKENILWTKLEYRKLNELKTFVYIPLKSDESSISGKGLVAIMNSKDNSIQSAYYTQTKVDNKNISEELESFASESVYNYLAKVDKPFHGNITFLNLQSQFLYEFGYYSSNNKRYIKGVAPGDSGGSPNQKVKNNSCTEYYLVLYEDDVPVSRSFLYTICSDGGAAGGSGCPEQTSIKNGPQSEIIRMGIACATHGGGSDISSTILNSTNPINFTFVNNADGTTTCTLIDTKNLTFFNSKIVFTLDANNKVIPSSPIMVITGPLASFTQDPPQNPIQIIYTSGGFFFSITGSLSLFGVSTPFRADVNVSTSSAGQFLLTMVGVPSYGFSVDGGRTYIY